MQDALGETGLAGSQLPMQKYQVARFGEGSDRLTYCLSLYGTVRPHSRNAVI